MRAEAMSNGEAVLCSICGTAVNRSPAQRKSRHGAEYCSRTCHYKGRSAGLTGRIVLDGYNLSADARARHSAAAARRYASGDTFPIPVTETQVSESLHALGVEHVHQHVIDLATRSVAVDLFFPDRNLVIEIDEHSLHGKPKHRKADDLRDRDLAAAGFVVRRVHDDRDAPAILARVLAVLA
jgi:very-short-patch-repair endonuclease